jgi:hypothetical protein
MHDTDCNKCLDTPRFYRPALFKWKSRTHDGRSDLCVLNKYHVREPRSPLDSSNIAGSTAVYTLEVSFL